jgi:hypothetical protein
LPIIAVKPGSSANGTQKPDRAVILASGSEQGRRVDAQARLGSAPSARAERKTLEPRRESNPRSTDYEWGVRGSAMFFGVAKLREIFFERANFADAQM